ncbi:MAG: hypothetical protein MJ161_06855 [Clostridia bacterium]|nr:hypothetical protein [Clostridia bacterium]
MRHSYSRLWDGRIIDSTEGDFYEYKDGEWVEVEGPLTMHMLWFAENLESMEELKTGERCVVIAYGKPEDFRYMVYVRYNEEGEIMQTCRLNDSRYRFRVNPNPEYADEQE